jgi:hypothetical protein
VNSDQFKLVTIILIRIACWLVRVAGWRVSSMCVRCRGRMKVQREEFGPASIWFGFTHCDIFGTQFSHKARSTYMNWIYLHSVNPNTDWHHRIWDKSSTNTCLYNNSFAWKVKQLIIGPNPKHPT